MPLDANKAAHIQAVVQRSYQNRQQTVIFVYQASGAYSYVAVQVIFRSQAVIDPQIPSVTGTQPRPEFDVLLIAPLATSFLGVVYIANTTIASASAVASAPKYEVIEAIPIGIVPGGTHIVAKLRRLR